MHIIIRGHHLSITPAIQQQIHAKFQQMMQHFDQVGTLQIKLRKDHQIDQRSRKGSANHVAEAIIRLPKAELFAQASADNMYRSIQKLTQKLEKQLNKYRKTQQNALLPIG